MKTYSNKSGNSGVVAFQSGRDHIRVRFSGSSTIYTYSYQKAGKTRVENMKRLAEEGKGLSTYISRYVKDRYD